MGMLETRSPVPTGCVPPGGTGREDTKLLRLGALAHSGGTGNETPEGGESDGYTFGTCLWTRTCPCPWSLLRHP